MIDILKTILIQTVKNYATQNYEKDGWDYIIECFTDSELGELIGDAKTPDEALNRVRRTATLYNERRQEARAEMF